MNISEALKTEKKIKRKSWKLYLEPIRDYTGFRLSLQGVYSPWSPEIQDLLAEDWEVEDEKIELTYNQFVEGVKQVVLEQMQERRIVSDSEELTRRLIMDSLFIYWNKLKLLKGDKND